MRKLALWVWVSIAALAAADADAQVCGTILTSPVVLTADVVCGLGQDGLTVAASNVEIDLNGFSVIGGGWGGGGHTTVGVRAAGVDAVTIRGPGRIEGFGRPIEIQGGVAHTIQQVTSTSTSLLNNVSLSVVEDCVIALELRADPGLIAAENRIVRNRITNVGGSGILLNGCGVQNNLVQSNVVLPLSAIVLHHANGNWVLHNHIKNGHIIMGAASGNTIAANKIQPYGPNTGIWMGGFYGLSCGPVNGSNDNRITGNQIANAGLAMEVVEATGNRISDNTFANATLAGVRLSHVSFANDARFNNYINVATPVLDYGTGNLWP